MYSAVQAVRTARSAEMRAAVRRLRNLRKVAEKWDGRDAEGKLKQTRKARRRLEAGERDVEVLKVRTAGPRVLRRPPLTRAAAARRMRATTWRSRRRCCS